jgi:hypothetical protein
MVRGIRKAGGARARFVASGLALCVLAAALMCLLPSTVSAGVISIPASFRTGPPQGGNGDGLTVRFKDVTDAACGLVLCRAATDTVTVQVTTMADVNFPLNQGSAFGPFFHGGGYFQTRWDSYLDIRAAGDYVFSMQVDDQATITIGETTILFLDGAHWYENVTSDTVRFESSGSYPLRAYYADCQPCCRGFRLGGMGPDGSAMMPFTPGFDFNNDLGPCCTFGSNGPAVSVVPAALFFRAPPTVSVGPPLSGPGAGTIVRSWVTPNPTTGRIVLRLELARPERVWAEIFDATGRRIASLADGATHPAGIVSYPWSPEGSRADRATSGVYFYRVRTGDGSAAAGIIVTVR